MPSKKTEKKGDISKYLGFVVKGAMRQFSVCEKGNEHIISLGTENSWFRDCESYVTMRPSIYNIQACEDTELIVFTATESLMLMHQIPAWKETMQNLYEQQAIANQKRLHDTISLLAEQRYHDLVRSSPQFVQRFPQHFIASYLGVTKETLSRLRRTSVRTPALSNRTLISQMA